AATPDWPGSDPDRGGRFRTVRPLLPRRAVRAADSGPGQLAVYRGGRTDRHRGQRAADPADGGVSAGHSPAHAVWHGPAAAAAPDEAAGSGAHPRRHRRGGRRGRLRRDLVLRAAVHPPGAAGGADILGDGARDRGPGGHVVDDRPVCFAERVLVGAVHVAADEHVLIADHAPDHHVTHNVADYLAHYLADYLAYDVTIGVHLGFDVRVRIDLVGSAAVVGVAFVLVRIYVGELTRVPAVIRSGVVTAGSSARDVIASALRVAARASPAQAASAGLNPLVTLAGVPRLPWAVKTAVEMAIAKTPPRRCAM